MANYYHEARAHTKKLKALQEEGAKRRDRRLDAKAEAGVVGGMRQGGAMGPAPTHPACMCQGRLAVRHPWLSLRSCMARAYLHGFALRGCMTRSCPALTLPPCRCPI
jgi:hypothetical protein